MQAKRDLAAGLLCSGVVQIRHDQADGPPTFAVMLQTINNEEGMLVDGRSVFAEQRVFATIEQARKALVRIGFERVTIKEELRSGPVPGCIQPRQWKRPAERAADVPEPLTRRHLCI